MLTNADRLDALESAMNAVSIKMNNLIEFYETRDATNDIMDDVRTMFERLDSIERILNSSREIFSMIEENYV
jgi:Mg2+ and Co2+ transporter CorA